MNRPATPLPVAGSPMSALPADPSLLDAAAVLGSLGVDSASGLRSAAAAERLARVGPNRLEVAAQVPAWRKLLAQFADPLICLLLGAIVISVVAWALEGANGVPFESIVIAVIVVANALLGFVQERKAEQAVAALRRMAAPHATVLRGAGQGRPGRNAAVTQLPLGVKLTGRVAWLGWLGLHIAMLMGHRNRLATMANLTVRYLAWPGRLNVIVGDPP